MDTTLAHQSVTHTYTDPSGVVVVITGVPAWRDETQEPPIQMYDWEVTERLYNIINVAILQDPTPGKVHVIRWEDGVRKPAVDLEARIKGPGIRYGEASIKVWKRAFDRIHLAYSSIAKAVAEKEGVTTPKSPIVAYAGTGSLVIGLRATEHDKLFPDMPKDVALQALELVIDTSRWVEGDDNALPNTVKGDPEILDVALRAIEELAPKERDEIEFIELSSRQGPVIRVTPETRKIAKSRRVEAALAKGDAQKYVVFGLLDTISLESIHISVEGSEPELRGASKFRYPRFMLSDLLQMFGKRVKVTALVTSRQREILDVELLEESVQGTELV